MSMSGSPKIVNRFPDPVFFSSTSPIARSEFIRTSTTRIRPIENSLTDSFACGSNANAHTSSTSKPRPRVASRAASLIHSGSTVPNCGPIDTAIRCLGLLLDAFALDALPGERHERVEQQPLRLPPVLDSGLKKVVDDALLESRLRHQWLPSFRIRNGPG